MKTSIRLVFGTAALAITLQAWPAMAGHYDYNGGCYTPRGFQLPCPEDGFGSRRPVTLPRDRSSPAGRNTGIPVTQTLPNGLVNAQPNYFRPR